VVLLGYALLVGWPLVVAAVLGAFVRTERGRRRWYVGAGVALVLTALLILVGHGWRGGHTVGGMSSVIALLVGAGVAVVLRSRRPRESRTYHRRRLTDGVVVGALLLCLPMAQAAGTADLLFAVAGQCLALWLAAIVLVATRPAVHPHEQLIVGACVTGVLVLTAATAATATLGGAPDDTPFAHDTVPVAALAGVRVPPATARAYADLRAAVPTARDGRPTPMFALDEMAGLVYVLGGTAAGPEWTDDNSPTRSPAVLRLACRSGEVDRTRPPVVILDRPMDQASVAALASCGFDFPDSYRKAATAHVADRTIRLFVPTAASR
jgi:dienelactone hydrolase